MDKVKRTIQKLHKGILFLFIKLGIIEVKGIKVECNVKEIEKGVYEIEISVE